MSAEQGNDRGRAGRRRRLLALLSGLVVSVAGCFAVRPDPTSAGPAHAAVGGNIVHRPGEPAGSVRSYWTEARMSRARPVDPTEPAARLGPTGRRRTGGGEPVVVPGATGRAGASAADEPTSLAATSVPRPYTDLPDRLNGKVFFTAATGGNFVCSGTLINNPAKNLVWTAGHCVHDGPGGDFHRNWVFVPAYGSSDTAARPYGSWPAFELWTREEWATEGSFPLDLGVAVLDDADGERLGDLVGGQGIAFNESASQTYDDFGYPAAPPFDGRRQWWCRSALRGRDRAVEGSGPDPMRIDCDMTGGASGGGWITRLDGDGLGAVSSVNSYGYRDRPGSLYGPYHGDEARALYDQTKSRGPK
jgi:hypothetical protein